MNWFRNLTIQAQLRGAVVILIFGFVAIAGIYLLVVTTERNALHQVEQLSEYEVLVADAHLALTDAQRLESDFRLTFNLDDLEKHAEDMERLHKDMEKLIEDSPTAQETALLENLAKELITYEETFKEEIDSLRDYGFSATEGSLGLLNEEGIDIEKIVNKSGEFELISSVQKMRKIEKDYLATQTEEDIELLEEEEKHLEKLVEKTKALSSGEKQRVFADLKLYTGAFGKIVKDNAIIAKDKVLLEEVVHSMETEFDEVVEHVEAEVFRIEAESDTTAALMSKVFYATLGVIGFLLALVFYAVGQEFNRLLLEREAQQKTLETENARLNDSVVDLLEAVSDMSERDLTRRAPVAENVTGPVADALNLMTSETANVLNDIRSVAGKVADASSQVQAQGAKVTELANNERVIVEDTMSKLDEASKSMSQVAKLANACNDTAAKASQSTQVALETVTKTASGMSDIRETIAETEKRIKRLGERSQEINGVVEIINNIAERTHVLALNASMQAAAAGDAGRGFAVVADEVQRLAESSRQSTSEIAGLVGNIQAETAETMATMNKTIAQVVDGTELAQAAGGQMEATQKTTAELANAVEQIAKRSLIQSQVSNSLRDQAAQVQTSTQETSAELEQQSAQTQNLVEFSKRLVDSVAVFKLPEAS